MYFTVNNQEVQLLNIGKRKIDEPRKTSTSEKVKDIPQLSPLTQSSLENNGDNIEKVVLIDSEESSRDSLPSIPVPKKSFKSKISKDTNLNSNVPILSSLSNNTENLSLLERLKSKQDLPQYLISESQDNVSQSTVSSLSSSQCSIKSISSVSSGSSAQTLPEPDFILHPGEFDIVLCIDNAEFYGA